MGCMSAAMALAKFVALVNLSIPLFYLNKAVARKQDSLAAFFYLTIGGEDRNCGDNGPGVSFGSGRGRASIPRRF